LESMRKHHFKLISLPTNQTRINLKCNGKRYMKIKNETGAISREILLKILYVCMSQKVQSSVVLFQLNKVFLVEII